MPWLLVIKLSISIICGVLDAVGGYCFLAARRFIMPCVLGISFSIFSHTWWLGLTVLPVIATLCLGYKDFGSGKFSRGCWLFVQGTLIVAGATVTQHVAWYVALPYAVGAGVLGGTLVDVWQPLGDLIEGTWLGLIILFIH